MTVSRLDELVSRSARRRGAAIAIIEPGRSITYRELDGKMNGFSRLMRLKGLKRRERVGILSQNSIESIAVYFAISHAGGVSVPLNHTLDSNDLVRQAGNASLAALYVGNGTEVKAHDIVQKVKTIRFFFDGKSVVRKDDLRKRPVTKPGEIASIVYTSGTTRQPLGVMLTHKNLIANNKSIAAYLNLKPSDKIMCVLPLYYIYGLSLIISHILIGGTIILDNRFMYPNVILDGIEKYGATGFAGVSSHYAMLLHMSDITRRKLPALRYFMQAGDSMPPAVTKRLVQLFPGKKLYLMYGQTEASPRLTYLDPRLTAKKPDSIGKAIPGVEVKVVNERGKECKAREEGEITARGNSIMLGYWKNKSQTDKVIKNGWLHTGDLAFKDSKGDLFIVGRKKDFIKIGGNRVNPRDIEQLVVSRSDVMEAAAVGIKDAILGQKIRLFVVPTPGVTVEREDILRLCKTKLPSYKIPAEIVILKSMPKNSLGKIDREALKRMS